MLCFLSFSLYLSLSLAPSRSLSLSLSRPLSFSLSLSITLFLTLLLSASPSIPIYPYQHEGTEYKAGADHKCTPCPAGEYNEHGDAKAQCEVCAAGSVAATQKTATCTKCTAVSARLFISVFTVPNVISHQLKLTAARLRKGTTQLVRLDNSARIFINLSWYDSTHDN